MLVDPSETGRVHAGGFSVDLHFSPPEVGANGTKVSVSKDGTVKGRHSPAIPIVDS